ncbi:MAG TPA: CBS and ACT domain-containing protein [Treponemataceae bacterium]|jgi:acetoin utilization protein AcuB|nr:MAG: Inosine-5'-monophosphate dehydrogenase [Spirochaetes bacterium ADurb.Bin269]TAH55896.1 MAG: CBS domain-containing protein [Treponema sp.]HOC29451.1 CBS and ACT domain-containing protein [Treponemataceae bacterium]HPX47663.1 CBS and ACT domain-containing protein [Treponemataceae bacterium]HQL31957.1 CBS and ACT domain-containing protein [Treponemataceae bacterium]
MNVSYVMTRNPLYIHPDMSVPDARAFMKKEKVGRLPVLDKNNKLVGIVTERDLINASPSVATTLDMYEMSYLLSKLKVEKVMQKKVVTVEEDVVVEEAARIMVDNNISALPVMRDGALVGIVSDGDLYRLFINLFGARQEGVRLTILLPERTGELKVISQTIADMGGNIISLLICDGKDVTSKMCILKVSGIDRPKLVEAIQPFALEIIDVR